MTNVSSPVTPELISVLAAIVGEENLRRLEPMAAHTTFRIGGPADAYVIPHSFEEVAAVVRACRDASVPLAVVGNGSNLLVADEGLRCVVMQLLSNLCEVRVDGVRVIAQAGATNAQVAAGALDAGLTGFEFASGIPGTAGGAAVMNAGAYGGEFKDICVELSCVTPEGELVRVGRDQADWSYRHSMMGDRGYTVVETVLELEEDDPAAIKARMDDFQERRATKQPLEMPSAGSTFKRPAGHFAAKLIQDAGLRGCCVGGAQVSDKHTGFLVNAGGATASDVRQLISYVQQRVFEESGVMLEPEVKMWGF